MPDDPDPDRPGFNDLVTPFIFVKHGDPDPVEWKRANPGWVSFPATFIPHKKPPPKWAIINGRRWPLDKRGQPWPRSRFGQPLCPLDEFPPGVPAPGTQGKAQEEQEAAIQRGAEAFLRGETSVEWFLETGARARAEREAREAANPSTAHTYDPSAPSRAYLAQRAGESDMLQRIGADPDGLGSIRRYQATAQGVDAFGRNYAAGARQRNAARAEEQGSKPPPTQTAPSTDAAQSTAASTRAPYADLITPVQFTPPGGRGPTRPPRGTLQNPSLPEAARMIRFRYAERKLREVEPNNPQLSYLTRPNSVPSEEWVARLEAELAAALARARPVEGPPPPPLVPGIPQARPGDGAPDQPDPNTERERATLRRNMQIAGTIQLNDTREAHHVVPGGGPMSGGRDAGPMQQQLARFGVSLQSATNGVEFSPKDTHARIL